MAINIVYKYVTDDGKQFDTYESAKQHESNYQDSLGIKGVISCNKQVVFGEDVLENFESIDLIHISSETAYKWLIKNAPVYFTLPNSQGFFYFNDEEGWISLQDDMDNFINRWKGIASIKISFDTT